MKTAARTWGGTYKTEAAAIEQASRYFAKGVAWTVAPYGKGFRVFLP